MIGLEKSVTGGVSNEKAKDSLCFARLSSRGNRGFCNECNKRAEQRSIGYHFDLGIG